MGGVEAAHARRQTVHHGYIGDSRIEAEAVEIALVVGEGFLVFIATLTLCFRGAGVLGVGKVQHLVRTLDPDVACGLGTWNK